MHRPFHDGPLSGDAVHARLVERDGYHVEVHVWCEPAVQSYLRVARGASLLERREIEEAHIDRALDLEYLRGA